MMVINPQSINLNGREGGYAVTAGKQRAYDDSFLTRQPIAYHDKPELQAIVVSIGERHEPHAVDAYRQVVIHTTWQGYHMLSLDSRNDEEQQD